MPAKCYEDLRKEVWDRGTCSGCGACVAVCPADALCFDEPGGALRPRNIGYCKQATDEVPCGACYHACPRTSKGTDDVFGQYSEIVSARATLEIPRKQSGGAVTAILASALRENLIDAVVTVTEDRWTLRPSSVVITDEEELIHQAGSRYNWWVPLVTALKTAVIDRKFRRLAVVGVPCVIQAIRNIRESDNDLLRPYGNAVRLTIGLFCTETFDYSHLVGDILGKEHHIESWKIDHLDVRGKLDVTMRDGTTLALPLKDIREAIRPGCHYCRDFTATSSDLSAGAVGSSPGHTTLIVRSEAGKMFVDNAVRSHALLLEGVVDEDAIERLGKAKIRRAME